jgi:hypothetical protein
MLADRQVALLARAGSRPVDRGEPAAILGIVGPDCGRGIGGVGYG